MSSEPPTSSPPPGSPSLWESSGGTSNPAPSPAPVGGPGGDRLDPLSQRLLKLAGLLSVLLVLVLLNSFLNDDGSSSSDQPEADPVASAVERVEQFSGGRMSLYIVYSSPGLPAPLIASGSGAYNEETGRSRITLDIKNPITGEPMQSVQISDGKFEYMGGVLVDKELPPGKKWVRTEDESWDDDDENPLSFDDSIEMLGSSETRLVGRESINGKMTRRYRGEIKISEAVEFLREKGKDKEADAFERIQGTTPTPISAESWIDDKDLLRRMRMVIPMPGEPGEPPITVDLRMDFFDYGAEPDIKLPDPATVVEGPLDEDEDAPAPASIS